MEGKKVDSPPDALTTYELCKTFKCLPSELMAEDNKKIEELLVVMNAIGEHEKKGDKKQKREQAKQKLGGVNARR